MKRRSLLVMAVAVLLLGYGLSLFTLQQGAVADLQRRLQQLLPTVMDAALVNGDQRDSLFRHSETMLQEQLQALPVESVLTGMTLGQCSVARVQVGSTGEAMAVTVSWQHEGVPLRVTMALDCQPDHGVLLLQAAVMALLVAGLVLFMPVPLSAPGRQWLQHLQQQGFSRKEARARIQPLEQRNASLSEAGRRLLDLLVARGIEFEHACEYACDERAAGLAGSQPEWLALACQLGHPAPWAVAHSEDQLAFDLPNGQVLIRGIAVPLTRTPLLYYGWYGRQRIDDPEGEGWLTNPPSNRPDKAAGEALADFMAAHQGHGRSISELRDKGLRAKTLDQNRNRIKEELTAVLGELAEPWLFDSLRCGNAARFRYRLRLAPAQIQGLP